MVAVTQPRRVAAITVAQRVATERNGMLCHVILLHTHKIVPGFSIAELCMILL